MNETAKLPMINYYSPKTVVAAQKLLKRKNVFFISEGRSYSEWVTISRQMIVY